MYVTDRIVGHEIVPNTIIKHPDIAGTTTGPKKMCEGVAPFGITIDWWKDRDTGVADQLPSKIAALRWGNPIDPGNSPFRNHYPTLCCTAGYDNYGDEGKRSLRDAQTDCARNGGVWHTRNTPNGSFVCEVPSKLLFTRLATPYCGKHVIGFVPEPYPAKNTTIANNNKSSARETSALRRANTGINEHPKRPDMIPRIFTYKWNDTSKDTNGEIAERQHTKDRKSSKTIGTSIFNPKYNIFDAQPYLPDSRYNTWTNGAAHYSCYNKRKDDVDTQQAKIKDNWEWQHDAAEYWKSKDRDDSTNTETIMRKVANMENQHGLFAPRPFEWINRKYWSDKKRDAFLILLELRKTKPGYIGGRATWDEFGGLEGRLDDPNGWFGTENKEWKKANMVTGTGPDAPLCQGDDPRHDDTPLICIDKKTDYMEMIHGGKTSVSDKFITDIYCAKDETIGRDGIYNEDCGKEGYNKNTCNSAIVHDDKKKDKGFVGFVGEGTGANETYFQQTGSDETSVVNNPQHMNLYYIIKMPKINTVKS